MANKKRTPVRYTSREFATIKQDLVEYAKRYYPESYRDFGEASFGALMMDTVSYAGDILSFYLDYQVNESFLDSAAEYNNVIRLARQQGYKNKGVPSTSGVVDFFIIAPANNLGLGADSSYLPILKRGTLCSSAGGGSYILSSDVDFSHPKNQVVAARTNPTTGVPTSYAVRAIGKVISGKFVQETFTVGNYQRFRKLALSMPRMAEVINVFDSEGNEYYEVDHLSQDVIYRDVINRASDNNTVPSVIRPYSVPRRFAVETIGAISYLQFGFGSDNEISQASPVDPSNVVLQFHAKDYISDESFDPSKLIFSDKFGISPTNTTITVSYRVNTENDVNASAGTINTVNSPSWSFRDVSTLNRAKLQAVQSSIECNNIEPLVGDVSAPSSEEIRQRSIDYFSTQNRAVTKKDYESMVYRMPHKFGAVKRCKVVQQQGSFRRNLNLFVLSEDTAGALTQASVTLKNNLKTWLNKNKMVNDTIDILDAYIINIGIEFEIIHDLDYNKYDVLSQCISKLTSNMTAPLLIGQPLYITDVYNYLNDVIGVVDTTKVKFIAKTGGRYSEVSANIEDLMSPDGRYIQAPDNVAFEIKFPNSDIKGTVK
tara:strand:- start:4960 stop:6756 length:1797 start_codon:yes stop_codon:yes gene_type:complete